LAVKVHAGQAGALAGAAAHVSQIVAADLAALGNFYLKHQRAVQQKALFYADTAGNAADGDAAGVAALAVGADNHALKNLNALFVAFADFLVHFDGVAAFYVYNSALLKLLFDFVDNRLHNLINLLAFS